MPDYLIKDNASKRKTQYDLSINTFNLETIVTVRIWDYSLKNVRDLIWSDLQKYWRTYLDIWSMF